MQNTKRKIVLLITVILIFTLTSCLHKTDLPLLTEMPTETSAEAPGEQKSILITNATLFSGNPDDEVMDNANVLIENGKISQISTNAIQAPMAQIVDGQGKMVIPGLIDSHTHIFGSGAPPTLPSLPNPERNASAFLYAGITTVVDMGGPVEDLEELNRKIMEGRIAAPRLYYTGKIFTCENGHPAAIVRRIAPWLIDEYIIYKIAFEVDETDSDEDLREMILENKEFGATFTKLAVDEIPLGIPTFKSEQIKKIAEASRREGFITVAHIGSEENIITALDGGVRIFIHGPYRSAISEDTLQRMKSADCIVTPTLSVFDNVVRYGQNELEFTDLDREIGDPVVLAEYEKTQDEGINEELRIWVNDAAVYQDIKFENVKKIKAAGIPIIAGSDSTNIASIPGSTLHRELELLVTKCGFTPLEAISAATFLPGKLYSKITGQPRTGYLQEGMPADLLILNGDFREGITETRNIHSIILKGRFVDRKTPSSDRNM